MEPLLKCGEIKSHGQLTHLTHDLQLNLVVSVWDEKDGSDHSITVRIIDVNSGNLVSQAAFKNTNKKLVSCAYHPFLDKLVMTDGNSLCVRRDTNGRFLLTNVFACPVSSASDEVSLEILLPHAIQLKDVIDFATSCSTSGAPSIPESGFSSRKLNFNLIGSQLQEVLSQISPETSSVTLKLRQSTFCSLLYWLMNILGDSMHCGSHLRNRVLSNAPTPPLHPTVEGGSVMSQPMKSSKSAGVQQPHSLLPVVSSLYLQAIMSLSDPYNEIPKEHMFAEVFRYETFLEWPHIDYEWAGPNSMALAGFYYQPACRAEDRAVCFQCGVSLVSWEPTDEPWSEHERHAPACPMVTGDVTSNVPLAESESFEPAQSIFSSQRFSPTENSSSTSPSVTEEVKVQLLVSNTDGIVITATPSGNVVLWDATRRLRKCACFYLISDIRGNQVLPNYKEKAMFSCYCLPDVSHLNASCNDNDNDGEGGRTHRKSSLSKTRTNQNTSDDESIRIVAGGTFGEQNELFVFEYVLEPPLWDSRCQTEGARSGAQPPFTSSSSAPINDQFNILQYDMWDDDSPPSPPYEETSDNDDGQGGGTGVDEDTINTTKSAKSDEGAPISQEDADLQDKLEQQVEGAAVAAISELDDEPQQVSSETSPHDDKAKDDIEKKQADMEMSEIDVPPPDSSSAAVFVAGDQDMDLPIPEPVISGLSGPVRQVFITKQQPSGGTEPVFAKRSLKLPEMFQDSGAFVVTAIHHTAMSSNNESSTNQKQQRLVVVLNDARLAATDGESGCWACSHDASEPKIGGVVVYKFRPSLRRGGAHSSVAATDQLFDQPTAVYTIPAFLTSQIVHRLPGFLMAQSPDVESKSLFSSPCCYLLNLLPGANAIAIYAVMQSSVGAVESANNVTSLNPLVTLPLLMEDVDGRVGGEHLINFVYCSDVDTITAGSCQGRLAFWKKVGAGNQAISDLRSSRSAKQSVSVSASSSAGKAMDSAMNIDILEMSGGSPGIVDNAAVRNLLRIAHAVRLDQRYTISCPNGWSEMAGDQASRMHPGGLGSDLSPTRAGCGPNPPTRSFVRHGSCLRDTYEVNVGQTAVIGDGPYYSSFDVTFTHSLNISHIVASFGFDPLDCSLEDCKVYLLRQKDAWGAVKFGSLRQSAQAARPGLHALQSNFDFSSFEILCGPVDVGQHVLRNEQPGAGSPTGALKAVVMLSSPELLTSSSRSLTVLVEYSAGSLALASAYNQQQHLMAEGSVLGSTTPPPPSVGPPVISATLSLTPMYLPKYKQFTVGSGRRHFAGNVDLTDFLYNEECQQSFFALCLSYANSSGVNNVENQAAYLDSLSLLSWLLSVCQYQNSSEASVAITFARISSKVIENFDLLVHMAFTMPATCSREAASVLSEIVLLIAERLNKRGSGPTTSISPLIDKFFDGIFMDQIISSMTSPTIFHLFLKLACRLSELQLAGTGGCFSALPAHGFSKLASLGEMLSVQTLVERVPMVSGDSLTSNSRVFDFPLPTHLLDTFTRPSYAAVVAGLFNPASGFNIGNSGSGGQALDSGKGLNDSGPWSNIIPTQTSHSLLPGPYHKSQQQGAEAALSSDTAYASGPRHIFGLIEYECLNFRFHKFCQGARAGSPRSGFKVAPPPSIKLPINAPGASGLDPNWQLPTAQTMSQPLLPLVHSYFPTLSEANTNISFTPGDPKKTSSSGLMFTVDEVPGSEEVPVTSNAPISVIYVANPSSVPPTPKPTPYITPSVTPPNELSSAAATSAAAIIPSILPSPVSVPSQLQSGGSPAVPQTADAVSLGHNFDYLTNSLVLDYCNNWVAFDRSNASSRRFVDLDFGRPVVLTGFIIPVNADVFSVAVDVWLKPDDDKHHRAKRICSHMRLRQEPLVMLNLQPPPVCRFVRLWTFFTVGATQGRLSMCVGQYYGYSLLSACRLSSLSTIANLVGPSFSSPPSLGSALQPLVTLHSSVMQTCIEDQLYRFREAMADMNAVCQVYANPTQMATLWASGQRAIETRLRICVGGAFVWRCQLNHCQALSNDVRALASLPVAAASPNGGQEPLDKLQQIFYYLLRMFYVQARMGLHVNISVDDASRLFQAVCLFAPEDLRAAVGSLIVHFAADVDWWPEFFANGLQKLFASHMFFPDITSLASSANSISLSDYCNLFVLLIEANPDQASSVITSILEKLRSSLSSLKSLFDIGNVGMVLFLSICLDALLSPNHWIADMWTFAPGSLSSVKSQWNQNNNSTSGSGNGATANNASNALQLPRLGGGPLNRRGAVYKKKITKLSKMFFLSSLAKSPNQQDHVRFNIGADDKSWSSMLAEEMSNNGAGNADGTSLPTILTKLPVELCKAVTESLLAFVLESHRNASSQSGPSTMVFADVHALKLAAYLSCFAYPEITLSSVFSSKADAMADLLDLIVFLKDLAVSGESSVDATRAAIRAHAAECFLKTVLLAEKISLKNSSTSGAATEKQTSEESQGPFASLFAAIKEQEDAPRSGSEDLFNRFFALLHATRCHQIKEKSQQLGKTHKCKAAECQPAKKLLEHWKQCSDACGCTYKHCVPLRLLVNHWRTCKRFDVCATCKELAKFPLVFEPTVMNSIESVAECSSLPDDGNGIVPPPDIDPTAISSSLNDLLFAEDSDMAGPLDVCFVDDYFDEINQQSSGFGGSCASSTALSPPLPSFAADCRYDFSLLHHAKYLLGCLQARNYAEITSLPALKGSSKRSQTSKEDKPRESESTPSDADTSALIYQSLSRCLSSSAARSLSSLARCCEIIDDLLPYTKMVKSNDNSHEATLVSWFKSIIAAVMRAPTSVKRLRHTFEQTIALNAIFLETCNILMSKSNGSLMANSVVELFSDSEKLSNWMSCVLLIQDASTNGGVGEEYGPTFCQTFVSFLRGVLEISIEHLSTVGHAIANCLCWVVSHFIDAQLASGSSTLVPLDVVNSTLPFLVEICKNVGVFSSSDQAKCSAEWGKLGVNLVKVISTTCSMLPRIESNLRSRAVQSSSAALPPSGASMARGRGRGRGIYAHRWDEGPRSVQSNNDVVVMRIPPSNGDLAKCAYPETATAFGSLIGDELALLEQILSNETLFQEILNNGYLFSSLLSILYWNGICCQSGNSVSAPEASSLCSLDPQQAANAFGSTAYKTCQNIFNLLVDSFAQRVGPLLLNSVCPSSSSSLQATVGWDTRSAALVIVQAVLDKSPDTASTHRDVICEILYACFEEIITTDKLAQRSRIVSLSSNKIFDLNPLARVVPGSVNLPLANLISQQNQQSSSSSAFTSSRSQRLLYELASAGKGKSSAPCPVFDGQGASSIVGDPRPVPIPTSSRGTGRAPAVCGYTFAPGEDHFSFAVHFSLPVVLAEVVIGCDLSHSRGHLPQAVEVEVKSDKQSSSSSSMPIRFTTVASTAGGRGQSPRDCIAIGVNPPRVASSLLISIYRPKSANIVYLNMISIRGFPLTSASGALTPQMLTEVDRISSPTGSCSISPAFGLPLASSEVTFLSLLHSITTLGRLRLLCSAAERNVSGLLRLASCSAIALLAPANIITPNILQNLLEMINICIDSLHDEHLSAQFVCSILDVYVKAIVDRTKPCDPSSYSTYTSPHVSSVDVTPFCLFVYSLSHWRTSFINKSLMDRLISHVLKAMQSVDSWQHFDPSLLPLIQCLAYLIWRHEKATDFSTESLVQLFNQAVRLMGSSSGCFWPPPVQSLICAIFNHRSVAYEELASVFANLFVPLVQNLQNEVQRYDVSKASLLLQPLANVFMSPKCLPWLLNSAIAKEVIQFIGTPYTGPLSACAVGFATALCRSVGGSTFVAHHLTDADWHQLLQNAVVSTCDFRYQDLVLAFFTSATMTNQQNQMRLGAAFASLLRNTSSTVAGAGSAGPLAGSMPCFMRAFCNRLLLADSEVIFYCTPDFDDPSTIISDTDIVPFAGFPATCLSEFVPPAYSSSVRLSGPGRCILLDLMTRSKRHHQLAASSLDVSNDDAVATKAAKMLKIASIAKRRTSKDSSEDADQELKVMSSLRDLCTKFAHEGGLERDAVSSSIAWRPPARWLIKKCFFAPRRQGDVAIPPTRSVRSLLVGFHDECLSAFYSSPLLELSGFAALPTPPSAEQYSMGASSTGEIAPTIPHILSAFAQVGGLDALALFFPIPSAVSPTVASSSATSAIAALQQFEQKFELPSTMSSVVAALMDPSGGDLPDDWVDIQDVDSDSTIEFASPKNVILVGGSGATFNPTSLLASTASTLGLNSAGSLLIAQQFFLPISALALRVFSRLPDLANLLTSVTCLPLTQAALRLALGLGVDMVQYQQLQGSSLSSSSSSSSMPGGMVKAMGLLPALPFLALDDFVCSSPNSLTSCLDAGCVDLLLAAMHVLSRQQDTACSQTNPFVSLLLVAGGASPSAAGLGARSRNGADWDEGAQGPSSGQHWAKGTGFGSGPTSVNQTMDARFSVARQRQEEQLLTLCFRLISRFVSSSTIHMSELPGVERMFSLISHSCFVKILSSYLQNDSIMDVSRHLLLYESALNLWSVLIEEEHSHGRPLGLYDACSQMTSLLNSFEDRLSAYVGTLRVITASSAAPESTSSSGASITESTPESDLDPLLTAVRRAVKSNETLVTTSQQLRKIDHETTGESMDTSNATNNEETISSIENKYAASLKSLQFRSWQVVASSGGPTSTYVAKVPYHFIGNMSTAGFSSSASRARRIAQEAVSLRSSLPLSLSSSVFVVVDEARLDVIKVLITGPSDTPYANGCFEFDVSLPGDYPASPPLVHLCTTGNGQVRFNPNLYNDGKVCLSVLNTWHGRPEEKWNPQTSSLLQVLVSIQSLILVSEPYFNEPGYERSRGSAAARIASAEYSAEIMAQTLKWAVVEQLRRGSACFLDVIRRHFAIKKNELLAQCDAWIDLVKSMGSENTTTSGTAGSGGSSSAAGGSSDGLFTAGPTSDVVLIGSSGRRFQQMLVALRRSVDQVREELKNLDTLVTSGDVFGSSNNTNTNSNNSSSKND